MLKVPVVSFLFGCFCFGMSARSQAAWLTIVGDPESPQSDVVEVETKTLVLKVDEKILVIRVNRDKLRTSWDGVSYRSYTATVSVSCDLKSARYLSLNFYMLPLWEGSSHKTSTYSEAAIRPMLFRDMNPNPTERIIRAACPAAGR